MRKARVRCVVVVLAFAVGLCTPARAEPVQPGTIAKINHIVIIVQENRSFDNLFDGFPHAHSSPRGKLPNGGSTALVPISLTATYDISHAFQDAKMAYDRGKMDGFAYEYSGNGMSQYSHPQYGYVPRKEVTPYWDLAHSYVLDDRMFASQLDGSYVAHQYLIAGWAGGAYNYPAVEPWGCDAPSGNAIGLLNQIGQPIGMTVPCFSYKTIADELDAKGIAWRYYSPKTGLGYAWNAFDAVSQIRRGPDWKDDVVTPETRILQDVAKGRLANVTWVVPSMPLSDHTGSGSKRGPSWVASVVNAIGKSSLWSSTAIFVTWDDWGGWYDDVAPPQLDYGGLGFRVPMICISPFAKADYVDHTRYEFGSLLRFIELRFGLPSLGRTDARAEAPLNCFNFGQQPRAFHGVQAQFTPDDLVRSASDNAPDEE
jgi:phospholipase C